MQPDDSIRFGTDGWRGRIGDDYTFANVRRCTQGFARYLLECGYAGKSVVVGYDQRFASEHFAATAAQVLAEHGLNAWLTDGATPTPVIAYAVLEKQAVGAINITASHNPPQDNGFKLRDHTGGAVPPAGLARIEANIPAAAAPAQAATGRVQKFDAAPAYIHHLRDVIDLEPIKRAGLRVMVDSMWGNGAGWFARLLAGGSTTVLEVHNQRNPVFPEMSRPEPIPPNIDVGLRAAVAQGVDVCLITDGDADRVGVGDEHGVFINQLCVYALLAYHMLEVRGERGPIVRTLSTTTMLDRLGELYGVPVHETGVGFKYVAPKMTATNALMGGEESGGFAFRNHVPERDGILAGLFILELMCRLRQKPSQLLETLFERLGARYFYDRIDSDFPAAHRAETRARVAAALPAHIAGLPVTRIDKTDGYKYCLQDGSWLLIRFSGTEPIIRVYCETTTAPNVQPMLQAGLQIAGLA